MTDYWADPRLRFHAEEVTLGSGHAGYAGVRRIPRSATGRAGYYARYLKGALDRVFAAILLLVLLPVVLLVATAVRLSLGPSVIFMQERVGKDGKSFWIYKFRTMRPCRRSEHRPVNGPDRRQCHKHPNDPRLVPLGRFLRKWSLDELPQLLNVVRGEMSLVGPRPELVNIVAAYEPWQHERHAVKPGITGLWQVTERGTDGLPMHAHTTIDVQYARELSFKADVKLLALTIPAMLGLHRGF